MSFLKSVGKTLIGGLLGQGILGLFGSKKKDQPRLPPPPGRDDAAAEIQREDELARRRGAAADRITGASGEPAGGIGRLIVGS